MTMQPMGRPRQPGRGQLVAAVVLLALAVGGPGGSPASAAPLRGVVAPAPTPTFVVDPCLPEPRVVSFTATPGSVEVGTSTTLQWNVEVPNGCNCQLILLGQSVPLQGSRSVQFFFYTTYTLNLSWGNPQRWTSASTAVSVTLPVDPEDPTRKKVTINSNNLAPLLVQALAEPNTTVSVANNVQLDLSGFHDIALEEGVILKGGRGSLNPGPRLYTTTHPSVFFKIVGDKVRITGVRIQGPDYGVMSDDVPYIRGIHISTCETVRGRTREQLAASPLDIEIDHNEISGFHRVAISVWDNDDDPDCDGTANPPTDWWYGRMVPSENPTAVRIHDNYIHHNQHEGGDGYGVSVGDGAYVLIERNVFDWNRHAIEGDGHPGSGYAAYRNLVLTNGGLHRWWLGAWSHTHQFDMHGTDNCGILSPIYDSLWNCGQGGHSMYIRYNTFLYTAAAAIKLRGTPQIGMFIGGNVFRHDSLDDAIEQTQTGIYLDCDGIDDLFMATGATWWYSSGGAMPWAYLNTSTKRLHEVSLNYVDGDNRCDVIFADGSISSGGTGAWIPVSRAPRPATVVAP